MADFTFLSERVSTEEGFVDELLSRVEEAPLSYRLVDRELDVPPLPLGQT